MKLTRPQLERFFIKDAGLSQDIVASLMSNIQRHISFENETFIKAKKSEVQRFKNFLLKKAGVPQDIVASIISNIPLKSDKQNRISDEISRKFESMGIDEVLRELNNMKRTDEEITETIRELRVRRKREARG